jgi:site-specific DNA-methyltransferase (adenine-specific)
MVAIEDAGWEIRDTLMWVYGSGFPKSLDISKAIDKAAGVEREIIGTRMSAYGTDTTSGDRVSRDNGGAGYWVGKDPKEVLLTGDAVTDAAKQWSGWGTALKPAWEPIILARKPLEGTVAQNVMELGCGGINIDGCRVAINPEVDDMLRSVTRVKRVSETWENGSGFKNETNTLTGVPANGRFPANLIHDGSQTVLAQFPQSSTTGKRVTPHTKSPAQNTPFTMGNPLAEYTDSGSAARFFYCAKASKSERELGCESLPLKTTGECTDRNDGTAGLNSPRAGAGRTSGSRNHHPTVKPLALLQYLCRLITPPNGLVLDPFGGSGTTGIAATREGFNSVLIELDPDNYEICKRAEHI